MPSGHTDRSTINERKPLTRSMNAMIDRILANARTLLLWANLATPDKNTARALRDRGIIITDGPIRLVPNWKVRAGRA